MTLDPILSNDADPSLSLYFPTEVRGPTAQQNKAELKALIRQAEEQLQDDPKGLLDRARAYLDDISTWSELDAGLALLIAPDVSERLVLTYDPGHHAVVQRGFYLRPLVPLLSSDGRFYVLTIDPLEPRLFEGDRRGLRAVEDAELGETLRDILARTELPADIGFHPTGPAATTGGTPTAKYHSLGESPRDYKQSELEVFAQRLAKAVDRHLANARRPLVLVGDPNLLGAYRKHAGYRWLCAEAIDKNPSHLGEDSLHELALSAAEPALDSARRDLIDRFESLAGRQDGRASARLEEILPAAHQGRVEALLVAPDGAAWGRLSENGELLDSHRERQANSVDLIDRAIAASLGHGGEIALLDPGAAADGGPLRAIFRY